MKNFPAILLLLLSALNSSAQINPVVGDWEGKLTGTSLRLVFHITEADGKLNTKMDSPDQGAYGLLCDKTVYGNSILNISFSAAGAAYEGTLDDVGIQGKWTQRGTSVELNLKRKTEAEKPVIKPQTPQPPFAYQSEEVEYDNAAKTIHYGATVTYPRGAGPFAAAILITGSGLQDRDETIGLHKPFAVIADYLTRKGIAVIRVDDRGTGKTTGDAKNSTSLDFAQDIETTLAYLKSRKEINSSKIGLIGHSEGGMIAPMVAARIKGIAFVVLLAGPGIPIDELMTEQSGAVLRSIGVSEEAVASYLPFYQKLIAVIPKSETESEARKSATELFQTWQKSTGADVVKATTGAADSATSARFIDRFVSQVYSPWFRYFLQYNPQPALQKIKCPVLALNGEKDVQVIAKSNLAGIEASLRKNSKNKIQQLPGLNHLFQTCKTCGPGEYLMLDETFSPTALEVMGNWVLEVTK